MKRTITKILSILCLVAVLACGFMPFAKITGQYKEILGNFTVMFASMTDEQATELEQALEQFGIKVELKASFDAITNVTAPIEDGEISIMDFFEISKNAEKAGELLGGLTTEGMPEEQHQLLEQTGLLSMIDMLGMMGTTCIMLGGAALAPVGLFGLLALAIIVRIILRLFNRRGLGVLITLLAILNAAVMIALPVGLSALPMEGVTIGAEVTFVPYVLVGGCIASCIIWGIGRGAKVKVVKEEVIVETPSVEVPVEETVVEEIPVAGSITLAEEVTEETQE